MRHSIRGDIKQLFQVTYDRNDRCWGRISDSSDAQTQRQVNSDIKVSHKESLDTKLRPQILKGIPKRQGVHKNWLARIKTEGAFPQQSEGKIGNLASEHLFRCAGLRQLKIQPWPLRGCCCVTGGRAFPPPRANNVGRNLIHQSLSLASSRLMHRDHSPELKISK